MDYRLTLRTLVAEQRRPKQAMGRPMQGVSCSAQYRGDQLLHVKSHFITERSTRLRIRKKMIFSLLYVFFCRREKEN